jgi:hypothetical protein
MHDLASRITNRIQPTTDGHRVCVDAAESAFGANIGYAMRVKVYGTDREESEARCHPMECKVKDVSASFVERQNLTMRIDAPRVRAQRPNME